MWMCVSSIPMLHPMPIPSLQHADAMRTFNIVHMANEFMRSNIHLSHHLSFLPQGAWPQRQSPSMNDLPSFFLPNGMMNIVWLWDGLTAAFLFFALLSHHLYPWSSIFSGTFFTTPPSLDLMRVEFHMLILCKCK